MTLTERLAKEGRLRILQLLSEQVDHRLSAPHIRRELSERWVITRSEEWLTQQLAALCELGAVTLHMVAGRTVAQLAHAGAEHLERLTALPGVLPPDPPRG